MAFRKWGKKREGVSEKKNQEMVGVCLSCRHLNLQGSYMKFLYKSLLLTAGVFPLVKCFFIGLFVYYLTGC